MPRARADGHATERARRAARTAAACLLAAALALAGPAGCGERPAAPKGALGSAIPDVALAELMRGRGVSLADYRGTRLLVNFWATWCEPCREEMAGLQRLSEALRPHGVAVLGVTVDADPNLAREFVLRHRLRFTNLSDAGMAYSRDALGIKAFPQTFVVDADGRIRARIVGARDWAGADGKAVLKAVFGIDP
jgi:peroxiredoxin